MSLWLRRWTRHCGRDTDEQLKIFIKESEREREGYVVEKVVVKAHFTCDCLDAILPSLKSCGVVQFQYEQSFIRMRTQRTHTYIRKRLDRARGLDG